MQAFICLTVFFAFFLLPALSAETCPTTNHFGIYDTGGIPNKPADYLPLKGRARGFMHRILWEVVETAPDKFDWSSVDFAMKTSPDVLGTNVILQVYVGGSTPEWLYKPPFNVAKVTSVKDSYPYYFDNNQITRFLKFHQNLAKRLASYPQKYIDSFVSIQICFGSTGDPTPWRGGLDEKSRKYAISGNDWDQYMMDMSKKVVPLYTSVGIPANKLLFAMTSKREPLGDFYTREMNGTSLKYPMIGHGYQINQESGLNSWMRPYAFTKFPYGYPVTRAEYDGASQNAGFFVDYKEWSFYFLFLSDLHFGLSIQNLPTDLIAEASETSLTSMNFFNKYAGQHDPVCSPGAFVAFRDGLDAGDFVRFSESKYGDIRNPDRFRKIAAEFANRGAKIADIQAAMDGPLASRTPEGLNDVGVNIGDNYERFITQIDPLGTSIGWWQVGKKEQPYGRFARSFDHEDGKNSIYLDVHDRLFGSQVANVNIRVVYYDGDKTTGTTGQWSLQAMTSDGKTSYVRLGRSTVVKITGSGLWKEAKGTATLKFSNSLPRKSDLVLVNRGNSNVLFHMVEITKA